MFAMRLKLGSVRNNEWKCCFCLHVRTATIVFGIWHLILHVLALTVLALIMRNHHIVQQRNEEVQQNNFLPTPLSKTTKVEDNPYYLPTTQNGRPIYSSDIDMGALMTVCTLSITLLMVYGAIKGKAAHVLPFFCLQMFDFGITTLTATGYFCYVTTLHQMIGDNLSLPFRNEFLQLSNGVLCLIVLSAFLIAMLWKAYWISVVWRCYKYLTLRQRTLRNTINYILPEGSDRAYEPDFPSSFRDHEAFGSGFKQTPPPSYQEIMEDQPPPYPAGVQVVQETPNQFRILAFYPDEPESGINPVITEEEVALYGPASRVENNLVVTGANDVVDGADSSVEACSDVAGGSQDNIIVGVEETVEKEVVADDAKVEKVQVKDDENVEGATALLSETEVVQIGDDGNTVTKNTPNALDSPKI